MFIKVNCTVLLVSHIKIKFFKKSSIQENNDYLKKREEI